MSDFVRIGSLGDFHPGRGRTVEVDGVKIAVFRTDDRFIAVSDACPHMGASLADGRLVEGEGVVECSWHHWRYDTCTGQSPMRPWAKVTVYDVKVEGENVLLRRPEPPPPAPEPPVEEWIRWDPEKHLKKKE